MDPSHDVSPHSSKDSARAVDVGAVLDAKHSDKPDAVVDLVQDAERAAPREVDPFEFIVRCLTGAVRVVQERPSDELDDRRGNGVGQRVLNGAARAGRCPELVLARSWARQQRAHRVDAFDHLAARDLVTRFLDIRHSVRGTQNL